MCCRIFFLFIFSKFIVKSGIPMSVAPSQFPSETEIFSWFHLDWIYYLCECWYNLNYCYSTETKLPLYWNTEYPLINACIKEKKSNISFITCRHLFLNRKSSSHLFRSFPSPHHILLGFGVGSFFQKKKKKKIAARPAIMLSANLS